MTRPGAATHAGLLDAARRESVWRGHGAFAEQAAELVAYAASPLPAGPLPAGPYPLPEPPCVAAWRRYVDEAREVGPAAGSAACSCR
jgi:hypothetical protein